MVQILHREPTGLEKFGTGLGEGISSGLSLLAQGLATQRLKSLEQQAQQRRTAAGLSALEGFRDYKPEQLQALAGIEPKSLQEIIKRQLLAPSEQAYAQALQQLLGGGEQQPSSGLDLIQQQLMPQQPQTQEQLMQQAERSALGLKPEIQQQPSQKIPAKLTARQAEKLAEFGLKKQEISRKEEAIIQKETKPLADKILKEGQAAKDSILTLKKMEKLIERGNLPPAGLYKLVKDIEEKVSPTTGAAGGAAAGLLIGGPPVAAIGGGIGALVNPVASLVESGIRYAYPDTEQFEKLSNSFIRGAKEIFGNRITNLDLSTFLTTIPNLTQTENGKKQIIKNLKVFYEAAEARSNALREILKENNGKRPVNLYELVEERASEKLDKLAEDFIA